MQKYDLKTALENAFEYATEINKYVDDTTPWKLDTEAQKPHQQNASVQNGRLCHHIILDPIDTLWHEFSQKPTLHQQE